MLSIHTPLNWNWLTLVGPDAQDFLHRLTTVNVRALEVGQGAKGCFLTPQGRIRAYFTLWNYRPEEYAFEFDGGDTGHWKRELMALIEQFHFGEKITLGDVSGSGQFGCRWLFGPVFTLLGIPPMPPGRTLAIDEEIRICNHGDTDFGRSWVTVWGRTMRLHQWIEQAAPDAENVLDDQVDDWRIRAVRPRMGFEITDQANPLEIGIPDAIAENKGCYPGQEVIEKIVSLGAPARRLALIEGAGAAPALGEKIFNVAEPPSEVGLVTSVTASAGKFALLAVMRKIHAKDGLEVTFAGRPNAGKIVRVAPYV